MKTKDAVSRLSYTISKGNKPNETDKVALNALIKFINNSDKEVVQENLLFAKLYTIVLSDFLLNYKDIDFANKQLNKELSTPLEFHIKILQQRLKTFELENYFKSKGITDPLLTEDNLEKYKHLFPSISSSGVSESLDFWDYDNVVSHLNRNINESLTTYKNV
jgi:hypothetical protein